MILTARCKPTVEEMCGQGIGARRETIRAVHEQWFALASRPGEPLAVDDQRWPRRLRYQSRGLLADWGLDCLVDCANTVLTELVSNALVHGGGQKVGFRLILTSRGIQVEVADSSTASAYVAHAGADDENGRGLFMVKRLVR